MDTTTRRILDVISSSIGDPLSINQLTERIKEKYGSAYYANIYQKLQELKNAGFLNLDIMGRASIIKLNFQNYLLIDLLSEIDIDKKMDFLTKRSDLFAFLTEMDESLTDNCAIKSISSINPTKNIKLNRMELLFLLGETSSYHDKTIELYKEMLKLQNKHNLKINNLILDKHDFYNLFTSDEINPIKEALSEKITFFCPQAFWSEIKKTAEKTEIRTIKSETKPANISDLDLIYNLNRFGYREFGSHLAQGKKFCIEYIITAILLQDDVRQTEAIAVILAKNNFKSNMLAFLSQKFQTAGKLIGILNTLDEIKPTTEIGKTIDILKAYNTEELPANKESIRQKLSLYNAV
jgi:hypothetical protein